MIQSLPQPLGRIYCIRNEANGKKYIGQTMYPAGRRWQIHRSVARLGKGRNFNLLHRAMVKYGPDRFSLLVLEDGIEKERLNLRERFWIRERMSLTPCGYNQESGGTNGHERAPHVADAARRRHLGRKKPWLQRQRIGEALLKRSAALRQAGKIPLGQTALARLVRKATRIPKSMGGEKRPGRTAVRNLIARSYGHETWKTLLASQRCGSASPTWKGGKKATYKRLYYDGGRREGRVKEHRQRTIQSGSLLTYTGGPWQKRAVFAAVAMLTA